MDEKDASSNGVDWFGNIVQKFEDLYNDVDQLVTQISDFSSDAVMQAESQLVTVGTTVKNFFQELDKGEDAHPESSEDKKAGSASDTSVVQESDDVVGLKSLLGSDVDSEEPVESVSSGLSLEQIGDSTEKNVLLQTPDNIVSNDAGQEIGLDIESKLLIPASGDVGDLISFTATDDEIVSSNASQEIGYFEAKLLIPVDDVGDLISFTETDDRSAKAFELEQLRTWMMGFENDGAFKLTMKTKEESTNPVDISSKVPVETQLANALEVDNDSKFPASATQLDKPQMYDGCRCEESEATVLIPGTEEQDSNVTDSGLQTKGPLIKMELGESCIVVDCAKPESSSGEAVNGMSYKKKLKDFASKMRLFQPESNKLATAVALPEKSNSSAYEFSESDWEIV